ncbi:MAG: hypothetical protein FVQ82_14760 [Planctomycetes bacterium]|nr:hypothetical protein [Planctomycetota bacterium]
MICTLADVKTRLGLGDTEYDDIINSILDGIDSIFDAETSRTLIAPAADVTETYTGLGRYLSLLAYPLISITSVIESYDHDFTTGTTLTAGTDYWQMSAGKNGILYRSGVSWVSVPDCIQVVYRAGFCAAGVSPGEGEHALPADLTEAGIQQASLIFKRRDDIGLSSHGFDGGSIDKFQQVDLLPLVKKTLKKYERPSL